MTVVVTQKAEKDPRMARLTKLWCEDLYKARYGITYPWGGGRDSKQLQRLLGYMGANVGKDRAEGAIQELYRAYLDDAKEEDKQHSFGWMCTAPQKWMKKAPGIPAETRTTYVCKHCGTMGLVVWNGYAMRCQCSNGDRCSKEIKAAPPEAFDRRPGTPSDWVIDCDHEKVFRGFASTCGLLKLLNPGEYQKVRQFWLDLFGPDRAKRLFQEATEGKLFIAFGKEVRYADRSEAQDSQRQLAPRVADGPGADTPAGGGSSGLSLDLDLAHGEKEASGVEEDYGVSETGEV